MGLRSTLGKLLFLIWVSEKCAEIIPENCTNYRLQFERVFCVPGEVAMLNSTLISPDVFDFRAVPHNITWYDMKSGEEMKNQTHKFLILKETLWILNVTMDDDGEYLTVVRTPSLCYMQSTKVVAEMPSAGECGRPQKAFTELTKGVADKLNCPLAEYIQKLDSYGIPSTLKWFKECDPIFGETNKRIHRDRTLLRIREVDSFDSGLYTCTLTFMMNGTARSVSETIEASVRDDYSFIPQIHEPANEIIKAKKGSNFTKRCLVFVPGVGVPNVDVYWRESNFFETKPSERIYSSDQRFWSQDVPEGVWLEKILFFSELQEKDFNVNYTCLAFSFRRIPQAYFTLIPEDPDVMLPIGCVLGGVTLLFIASVTVYYIFRIDIVLSFRRAFPVLYANKDLDGKVFDAYVAYPQPYSCGFSDKVERFALQTLPQVLENSCGYKLFIAGRDCLPGQSMVDSVEENIQASRRFLLLYTASTFTHKRHTSSTSNNNNNLHKDFDGNLDSESEICETSVGSDHSDKVLKNSRQQFECVTAMHRALLEGNLKVVLVELEEISSAQLDLLPPSVLHLRKKQGAVRLWKDMKRRQRCGTGFRTVEDENSKLDSELSISLCPTSRFWKEVQYHMPVRGKRGVYVEKTALLNV